MSDLIIETTRNAESLELKLKGRMVETARYGDLDLAGVRVLDIDFDGVTLINSKGIKLWREFMQTLPQGLRITYTRVALKVVNQLNLFPTFNGGKSVDVLSFYAPYFCEKCDRTVAVLLAAGQHFASGKPVEPPALTCETCKSDLEFDGVAQKYFLFLRRT